MAKSSKQFNMDLLLDPSMQDAYFGAERRRYPDYVAPPEQEFTMPDISMYDVAAFLPNMIGGIGQFIGDAFENPEILLDVSGEEYMTDEERAALPFEDPRRDAIMPVAVGIADVGAAAAAKAAPRVGQFALGGAPDFINQMNRKYGFPELPFEMNIIAGETAAVPAHMADDMKRIAKEAHESGLPMKRIFDATGWWRGKDKKWRHEIPDDKAALEIMPDEMYHDQSEYGFSVLKHDDLFEKYADLEAASIIATRGEGGLYNRRYDPGTMRRSDVIEVGIDQVESDEFLDTLLHEMQHGVQNREKFAAGSMHDDPRYWDMMGEVEARNVETRRMLSPDDRRMLPPWMTEDVPIDKQIVDFGDGSTVAMADTGYHWGRTKDLDELDPAFHGEGFQGAERSYTAYMPDELKPTFFYLDEGQGVRPEIGVLTGARSVYKAELDNLYDLKEDPDNLLMKAKMRHTAPSGAIAWSEVMPDFYQSLKDAGYKGFKGKSAIEGQGVAAVIGKTPVEQLPEGMGKTRFGLSPDDIKSLDKQIADMEIETELRQKTRTKPKNRKPPRMSREEAEAAGYWHPVGAGKRLPVPFDELTRKVSDAHDLVPFSDIDWERMQGGVLVPALGDRTEAGKWLSQVGSNPLSDDVLLEGGHDFMRSHDPYGAIWASDKGAAKVLHNKALDALEAGVDPYLTFMPMGHGATNFNTMMSDALLGQMQGEIKSGKISKTAKTMFDREMRKLRPEWKGIEDPDSMRMLDDNGALRHAFVQTVQKDIFQKRGFPNVAETRYAITDPNLMDTPLLQGGQAVGLMTDEIMYDPLFPHRTYNTQIGGQYIGGDIEGIPRDVLFPDFVKSRRAAGTDPASDYRSFDLSRPVQTMDQEWLDQLMRYLEARAARESL